MKRYLILGLLLITPAFAQRPALNSPVIRFSDQNGKPLAFGKLYSYQAGTTTPLPTYADSTTSAVNTNPVILDSTGSATVFLGANVYKLVLQNSSGVVQWTADNIAQGAFASTYVTSFTGNQGTTRSGAVMAIAGDYACSQVTGAICTLPPTSGIYYQTVQANGSPAIQEPILNLIPGISGALYQLNITNGGSGYSGAPTVTFTGAACVTNPTASANVSTGSITNPVITNAGSGYTSTPVAIFTGGGGSGAAATVTLGGGGVASVTVGSGGSGYTVPPNVVFTGGGGSGAVATAVTISGVVTAINVSTPGTGYTSVPTITFTGGGGGTGATAIATLGGGGVVGLTITNIGTGYTSAPTISFSGGGGTGAAATVSYAPIGSIASLVINTAGAGCSAVPVVNFTGGGGTGAAATALLTPAGISCVDNPSHTSTDCTFTVGGGGGSGTTTQIKYWSNGGQLISGRSVGTVYTNSNPSTLDVLVTLYNVGAGSCQFTTESAPHGTTLTESSGQSYTYTGGGGPFQAGTLAVPPNYDYEIVTNCDNHIQDWIETTVGSGGSAPGGYVQTSPSASQTVTQPSGTTLAVNSFNNVINAGSTYTTLLAAIAACGSNPTTIQVSVANVPVTTSISPPKNCSWSFVSGGSFLISSGQSVNFNGAHVAADTWGRQIFSGAGTVTGLVGGVPVDWLGATNSARSSCATATDSTAAIQATINAVSGLGGWAQFGIGCYRITSALSTTTNSTGGRGVLPGYSLGTQGGVSVILQTTAGADGWDVTGSSGSYLQWNDFEDFSIERSVLPTGTAKGISMQYVGGWTMQSVKSEDSIYLFYFKGTPGYGQTAFRDSGGDWGNNGISGSSYTTTVYGIYLDSYGGVAQNSSTWINASIGSTVGMISECVDITGTSINDTDWYNLQTAGCNTGLNISYTGTGLTGTEADIHFVNAHFDNWTGTGVGIHNVNNTGSNLGLPSIDFDGGWDTTTNGSTSTGFQIDNSSGVSVRGMQMHVPGTNPAFLLNNNSVSNSLIGNMIMDTYYGAYVSTGGANTIGNICRTENGSAPSYACVYLNATTNNTLTGNNGNGYFSYGIYADSGSAANDAGLNTFNLAGSPGTAYGGTTLTGFTPSFLATGSMVNGSLICTAANGVCPTGSTGISGLTAGYIPKAGSATTITANSHLDDGVTTAATITSTEPIVSTDLKATNSIVGPGNYHVFNDGSFQVGSGVNFFRVSAAGDVSVSEPTTVFSVNHSNGNMIVGAITPNTTYTVSTLPSGLTAGTMVVVTDLTSYTPGTCVGTGTDYGIAVYNGTSWSCH